MSLFVFFDIACISFKVFIGRLSEEFCKSFLTTKTYKFNRLVCMQAISYRIIKYETTSVLRI